MSTRRGSLATVALAFLLSLMTAEAKSGTADSSEPSPSVEKVIEEYCVAVSDAAAERRAARQALALKELRARVEERIAKLEQAKSELEAVIMRQESLRNLADQELVGLYSGMDPETAASQMDKLDAALASSVLRQLKPQRASAILNEMKPELAAKLVKIIASAPQKSGETK